MEEFDAQEELLSREIEALQELLHTPGFPRAMTQGNTPESSAASEAPLARDLAVELEEEAQATAPGSRSLWCHWNHSNPRAIPTGASHRYL